MKANFSLNLKKQQGSTLIEILLYMSLLTIILLIGTDILLQTGEFGLKTTSQSFFQEDTRFIGNRLTYEIHRAASVNIPAVLGDSGTTNKIAITVPVGFSTETREYELVGTDLIFRRLVSLTPSAKLNSNKVKVNSFSVTRLGNISSKPTLKILFELESVQKGKNGPIKKTFETVIGTR